MERVKKWILDNEAVVIILLVVVVLRIPSLLEPLWYGDEGIYMLLGMGLRKGLVWYKEIHDNKPPLLYLLASLSGNLMWLRLILMGWNLINVVVVWELCKRILKNRRLQIAMCWVFALLSSLPLIEGNIANGEIFMIMPIALGVLMLLSNLEFSVGKYLVIGLLMATGVLFKVPVIFDTLAIGLWLLVSGLEQKKFWWKQILFLGVGFLLPVLISVIYYFSKDAGWEYINAAFFQNVGYLSTWGDTAKKSFLENGLVMRGVAAMILSGLVIWGLWGKAKVKLIVLWLVWATFGAFLSERPYPHYLIQVLVPLVLGVGILIETKSKAVSLLMMSAFVGLIMGIVGFRFYRYPVISYYQKFFELVSGEKNLREYQRDFEGRVGRNFEVAKYLRMGSEEGERVFVWGDEPAIYVLSERLPIGRYGVAYHVVDFRAVETTAELLKTEKPKYIVTFTNEKRVLPGLDQLLESDYIMTQEIKEARIWRRMTEK